PLGVLNRWGVANRRRLLKQLSFQMIESSILTRAAAVHFTSRQERIEAEELNWRGRSVVIPLGVDLSQFRNMPDPSAFSQRFPRAAGRDVILFLSRIDRKKGLDLLLQAFASVHQDYPTALLVIAGGGDAQITSELKQSAASLGIEDEVLWTGFIDGEVKMSA